MLRLVDWFAVDEPVELRPPVVNIQARGAKDITIGNLRSSPRATNTDQLSAIRL